MSALVWNEPGTQTYETGVDRGVLYPDVGDGVVWNGLVSVEEGFVGGDRESFWFDGVKYIDVLAAKVFQAKVEGFAAPREFDSSLGYGIALIGGVTPVPGLILTRQVRTRFGFSYRTMIGDDVGYKLHLVYNITATPNGQTAKTFTQQIDPDMSSWVFDAVPPPSGGLVIRPTAHFIVDSTKTHPERLPVLEDILYGTAETAPALPTPAELATALAQEL